MHIRKPNGVEFNSEHFAFSKTLPISTDYSFSNEKIELSYLNAGDLFVESL